MNEFDQFIDLRGVSQSYNLYNLYYLYIYIIYIYINIHIHTHIHTHIYIT